MGRVETGDIKEKLEALRSKSKGDYNDDDMADILDTVPLNSRVVEEWKKRASDRKTVIFCSNITHAENVTETFRKHGVKANIVSSRMSREERQKILGDLESNRIQVLVNVAILTEGWDYPPISCVILLRCSSYKSTMIQMIGRGLRTVDAQIHPNFNKEDCIVLDFGISTLLHGNLEQEVDLNANQKGFKHCPACKKSVPKGQEICPLCGFDTTQELALQADAEAQEKRVLEDFVMAEINLLESSHFVWTDLRLPNKARIAVGFKVWCCVLEYQGKWIAIGGKKTNNSINIKTRLIHKGNKLQALAAGNDFISNYETHDSATKFAEWRTERPTPKQRQWLPPQFKGARKITKGDASAIITYSLQAQLEIKNVLSGVA